MTAYYKQRLSLSVVVVAAIISVGWIGVSWIIIQRVISVASRAVPLIGVKSNRSEISRQRTKHHTSDVRCDSYTNQNFIHGGS
jgi:hypothetical protein